MSNASLPAEAARVLYLSYDGMCDPLGSSQVLPYLRGLARNGYRIALISFEKPERSALDRARVRRFCEDAGISWHPARYHKQPPALSTVYDVLQMWRLALRLQHKCSFDVIHCRSYIPALVGLSMKRNFGIPFIFDMRGFWADERLEGGAWPRANVVFRAIYRYFKRKEAEFLNEADHVVSLTRCGRKVLSEWRGAAAGPPVTIIPCCVDFPAFPLITHQTRATARQQLSVSPRSKVLAYLGSLGGNYMLEEMLDFFMLLRLRYDDARFLFVTHAPSQQISDAARQKGIPESELIVCAASRADVSRLLAAADYGIAFKRPSFSAKACSPTKLGEMLALGLPVVINSGVGDVEEVMYDIGAGSVVHAFDSESYNTALDALEALDADPQRSREASRQWFDLESGIRRYDAIYASLTVAASSDDGC